MKSIPFLSDKAKALVIEAFDRNIVTFYDNVDKYVKLQLRFCEGNLKGKSKAELGVLFFNEKTINPSFKYIEDIRFCILRNIEDVVQSLYNLMSISGDSLPSDFMSFKAGKRWFELSGVKIDKHRQLYETAVKHYINEGLFLYDIKKGYFVFELEDKNRLVVPIEKYDPNDYRQKDLKGLWIQPLNETNPVAVARFLYKNKQEINDLIDGAVPERLTVKNTQEKNSVNKSSRTIGLSGIEFNRAIEAQIRELERGSYSCDTKEQDIILDVDEFQMARELFGLKAKNITDANKPKPSPKVNRKKSTAGSVNYNRQIVERNDDD